MSDLPTTGRGGATDEVYALLRKRITLGEYGPGFRLKELTLSRELGISRTPIRTAFQRLEQDGLLVSEPARGVTVAPWTDHDNDEVFDLRAHLESHAAALAANRHDEADLAEMLALNAKMEALVQHRPEDFRTELEQINRQFHEAILRAARSPRLAQMAAGLMKVRRITGAFFHYEDDDFGNSIEDHIAIARAIRRGNGELARALMNDHIRSTSAALRARRQTVTGLQASGVHAKEPISRRR